MIYGDDNIHEAMEKVALSKELILRAKKKALHQAKLLSKAGKHGPAARRKYQAYSVFNPPSPKGRDVVCEPRPLPGLGRSWLGWSWLGWAGPGWAAPGWARLGWAGLSVLPEALAKICRRPCPRCCLEPSRTRGRCDSGKSVHIRRRP